MSADRSDDDPHAVPPRDATDRLARLAARAAAQRERLGRPLTYVEKLLAAHLDDPEASIDAPELALRPDRVALQDGLGAMAWLQFETTGLARVAVPTTQHCDHQIRAREGAAADLAIALAEDAEVYDFLASASARFGAGFWKPGSGIIHQVLLENHVEPGTLLLGTDSHTPNAGGLGALAVGVGGAEAVDAMAGLPWRLPRPRLIGVRLTGALSGWAAPKDVILELAGRLGTKGATGAVIEYLGDGAAGLSATARATICNMGAELGATGSVFPADAATVDYLVATGRRAAADATRAALAELRADAAVERSPADHVDRLEEIDLDALTPRVNGPHAPDRSRPVAELAAEAVREGWPARISSALVGSCTNSSYEDLARAAAVARDALARGRRVACPLLVTPGSERVRATIERDGLLADLEAIGATVLANACGPCIGQWDRGRERGEANVIVTSYNRNFPARNDGDAATLAFVASPETVVAWALAGRIDVDPFSERPSAEGSPADDVPLAVPPRAAPLPARGLAGARGGFVAPPADGASRALRLVPGSERLRRLEPFPARRASEFERLPVLLKALDPLTTDRISPAGRWMRYRGHLDAISANLFEGAENAFPAGPDGERFAPGEGRDPVDGRTDRLADIARRLRGVGRPWAFVGGENVGEGSSREHAAMEPRHLGCALALARSFARIFEANLKRQGVLALVAEPAALERIGPDDRLALEGFDALAPGAPARVTVAPGAGGPWAFEAVHTLSAEELRWLRAGSALNAVRAVATGTTGAVEAARGR